ncbi:MAG: 50S ribosomal protein L20 [Candidatus Saccharimonadales bacterium]
MMRVKRGVTTRQRHNKIRKATKGFTRSNRSSIKRGKQALTKALVNATRDRKDRKRSFRALWNTRINAAARINGTTYSRLIAGLKKNKVEVDRKILSELAVNEPAAFAEIVKVANK